MRGYLARAMSTSQLSLQILDYLKTHSLLELEKDHGVYSTCSKSGTKISLNYDQIEAKESDTLAQECRGLVLRHLNNIPIQKDVVFGEAVVMALPFHRFFNFGQGGAANINFSDPEVVFMSKLDGTCIILYNDDITKEWHVATRSVPEADVPLRVGTKMYTFRELAEMACREMFSCDLAAITKDLDKDITYILELTSPYNRVVVDYPDLKLTLLGARNRLTGEEYDCRHITTPFPIVEHFPFNSHETMMEFVSSINPREHEGIVVRDKHFKRVKVKSALYCAYNKLLFETVQNTTGRAFMEIILAEKHDDVFPMLPKHVLADAEELLTSYRNFLKETVVKCEALANSYDKTVPENRKNLALKTKELGLPMQIVMHFYKGETYETFIKSKDYIKNGKWTDSFLDKLIELAKQAK